jgi:type II restriction enzyme
MSRTERQILGDMGESLVVQRCNCPKCKRSKTLKKLPPNFRCADVICDFCGYLAQVKATTVADVTKLPKTVMGAAWGPQEERMGAGIYFPLFLVLRHEREYAIYYLSADLQEPSMFEKRKALGPDARRAGWQGFIYRLEPVHERLVRLQ